MNTPSGLLFQASDFFPRVYASTGGIRIDVDHPLTTQSVCHSPLGRLMISYDDWLLESDWAQQQVPLGVWGFRIPDKPTFPPPEGESIAPMALILLTQMALCIVGQPMLAPDHQLSDYRIIEHYQHTSGKQAHVHCARNNNRGGKLRLLVCSLELTAIPPKMPLCRFIPTP